MSNFNPSGREVAILRQYLELAEAGTPPPLWLQRWIAQNVVAPVAEGQKPFANPRNRPARANSDPVNALAFMAAFIDPHYRDMPRSKGGRYAAIGDFLGASETAASERVSKYRHGVFVGLTAPRSLIDVAADYAERRGVAVATVRGWIDEWHEARMDYMLAELAVAPDEYRSLDEHKALNVFKTLNEVHSLSELKSRTRKKLSELNSLTRESR